MNESFDVVVVGARCAGAPLAIMLARAGLRVCVVDKDRFPSDTLSTHAIQPAGVQVLERIGVLDSLLEVAPPMPRLRIVFDDAVIPAADLIATTGAPAISVRRIALDEILVKAAADAGAEVRTETAVSGLVMDGGRVAGVSTRAGELRAPLVVGADGTRSAVARMVGAREYHPTPNGRVFMWAYYEADPTDGEMWIAKVGDCTYLGTPTDGGRTLVAVCPAIDRREEVRADRETVFEAGVRAWSELHAGIVGARREGPVRTMANAHGFFRPSAGPGWVLVGDAGHFKDPTPGQGIADALRPKPRSWPRRSPARSVAATAGLTRSCASGGDGATRTRGRCTGSPTTWVRPGRPHRCSARASGGSPRTPGWRLRWSGSSTTICAPRKCSRQPSSWRRWRRHCVTAAVSAGRSCVTRGRPRSTSSGGDARADRWHPARSPAY